MLNYDLLKSKNLKRQSAECRTHGRSSCVNLTFMLLITSSNGVTEPGRKLYMSNQRSFRSAHEAAYRSCRASDWSYMASRRACHPPLPMLYAASLPNGKRQGRLKLQHACCISTTSVSASAHNSPHAYGTISKLMATFRLVHQYDRIGYIRHSSCRRIQPGAYHDNQ